MLNKILKVPLTLEQKYRVLYQSMVIYYKLLLQIDLPSVSLSTTARENRFRWLNWIGHVLVKNVEIEIGGKKMDKHYGDWFHIWNSLTQAPGKKVMQIRLVMYLN